MTAVQVLAAVLIALGEVCLLISIVGVFRMDYVLNRMHATTIADTLATLLIVVGVMLCFGLSWVSAKLLLVIFFQWLTAPVSGHLIARLIYRSKEADLHKHAAFPEEEGES